MNIVSSLIANNCLGQNDFAIGTGQKTNLYLLCRSILMHSKMHFEDYFLLSPQSTDEVVYPIVDVDWMYQYRLIPPLPLDPYMLRSY